VAGRVEGKTALITGAGSGLGRGAALHLAREGANIVATDLDESTAAETAEMINAERQGAAISARHDATSEDDWMAALELCKSKFGSLQVLVNNAGISIGGDIESTDFATWKKLQEIDVDSVFWGCKLALPYMKDTGGSIINISSTVGILGNPLTLAYGTAKAAVRSMTKSIALHCARHKYNVRCNSVHPTFIKTPLLQRFADAMGGDQEAAYETLSELVPLGDIHETEDVTHGIIYLASDESRMMTGAELVIDGGLTCGYMPPI